MRISRNSVPQTALPAQQGSPKQSARARRDQHPEHIPETDKGRLDFGAVQTVHQGGDRPREQPAGKAGQSKQGVSGRGEGQGIHGGKKAALVRPQERL